MQPTARQLSHFYGKSSMALLTFGGVLFVFAGAALDAEGVAQSRASMTGVGAVMCVMESREVLKIAI